MALLNINYLFIIMYKYYIARLYIKTRTRTCHDVCRQMSIFIFRPVYIYIYTAICICIETTLELKRYVVIIEGLLSYIISIWNYVWKLCFCAVYDDEAY